MGALAERLGFRVDFYFAFISWVLLFTRILIMVYMTPFLGTKAVPSRVRMITGVALSIFLYPLIVPPLRDQFPDNHFILFALFVKEIFIGFAIGLVTLMVFYALESAGRIVDHQRGEANAQIFLPQLGQVSLFGLFNFWLAMALFLSIGGHLSFLKAFFNSFVVLPLYTFPRIDPGFSPFLEFIINLSGDVLIIAAQLSSPVLIAILLIDMVLGIANKMAPQINVFELGFAIKGYMGPLMIWVSIYVLVSQMNVVTQGMVQSIYKLIHLFAL